MSKASTMHCNELKISSKSLFKWVIPKIYYYPKRGKNMNYEDKTLICKECKNEFVFSAGEQAFYAERGLLNEPQRCKPCRDAKKNAARAPKETFPAVCADCGAEFLCKFNPSSDRPVYCNDCFKNHK